MLKKLVAASKATLKRREEKELPAADSRESRRKLISDRYITGYGIEIGALHMPLAVPESACVSYVDRCSTDELRTKYPELKQYNLVNVNIVDDGETLEKIAPGTQDFVIANHFLEHCENPIATVESFFRVLKTGGIVYMAVPDKRYTFDKDRPVTEISHLREDYEKGPITSRRDHFLEWATCVDKSDKPEERAQFLININYSIHYHVWTQTEVLEFITFLQREQKMSFEVKEFLAHDIECVCVLQKI